MNTAYVLCNPTYEVERFTFLQDHLKARGITTVHWTYGPWGSEIISEEYFKVYDPFIDRFGVGRALTFKSAGLLKAEVSLAIAMWKAYDAAATSPGSDDDPILVLESDVVLREDFQERMRDVLKGLEGKAWDYVSLGEGASTRPLNRNCFSSYFGPNEIVKMPNAFCFRCTDSMLFRRGFCKKLRETFLPIRECTDWWMNIQATLHKAECYWVDPPIVEQGSNRLRVKSLLPS